MSGTSEMYAVNQATQAVAKTTDEDIRCQQILLKLTKLMYI